MKMGSPPRPRAHTSMATSNVDIATSPPTLRTGAGPGTRGNTLSSGGGGDYNVSSASPIRYQEGIRRNTGATKSAAGTQLNDSIGNLVKVKKKKKKLPNYMKALSSKEPVKVIKREKGALHRAVNEPFEINEVSSFKHLNNTRKIHYPMMLRKYQVDRIDNEDMDDFRKAVELIVEKSVVNSDKYDNLFTESL